MSQKKLLILLFALLFPHLLAGETQPEPDPPTSPAERNSPSTSRLLARPLREGSPAEEQFFSFLKDYCRDQGLPHQVYSFSSMDDSHSFSSLVSVTLPSSSQGKSRGESRGKQNLVVVIPVSDLENNELWTPFLGLRLAEELQKAPPENPVTLVFAGAETNRPGGIPLGSQLFLDSFYPVKPTAVITLRISGRPQALQTIAGSRGHTTPAWWLREVRGALGEAGFSVETPFRPLLAYRLGISLDNPGLRPWQDRDFPALMLTGQQPAVPPGAAERLPADTGQWISQWSDAVRKLSGLSYEGRPRDTHYLLLPEGLPGSPVVEEGIILRILTIGTAVLLLILFGLPRLIRSNLRYFLRKAWTLPIFFVMAFVFLLLGTGLIQALLNIQETAGLWQQKPLLFFLLKISAAVLLFSVSYPLFRRFPLSRSSHFYSFSAAMTAAFNGLVLLFYDISYSLPLFWAVGAVTLFAAVRSRPIKILLFFLSPLGLFYLGFILFSLEDIPLIRIILLSPLRGNIILTLLLLPFLLLQSSLHFSRKHRRRDSLNRHPRRSLFLTAAWGTAALGLTLYLIAYSPYTPQNQPIRLVDRIDGTRQERRITLESPAPLPQMALETESSRFRLAGGPYSEALYPEKFPRLLDLSVQTRRFLDRRQVDLGLTQWGTPYQLEISLQSEESLVIYESPFPYTVSLDQSRVAFHIGRNPPNPLEFSFTMKSQGPVTIRAKAVYRKPPYPLRLFRAGSAPSGTSSSAPSTAPSAPSTTPSTPSAAPPAAPASADSSPDVQSIFVQEFTIPKTGGSPP